MNVLNSFVVLTTLLTLHYAAQLTPVLLRILKTLLSRPTVVTSQYVGEKYEHKEQKIQAAADDPVTVEITQGTLQGRSLTTEAGVSYYSFQGIPFAQPPVGDFRFKPPQLPAPSWDDVREATMVGPDCPQGASILASLSNSDEDCLYINVYTTELPSEDSSPNLPVMVWIYGGGFSTGSGSPSFYGPDYLINNEGFVLVTFNYRVGVLGFLGLDHPDISKNNGLKDQVAALKWVQSNIDKFGGNPEDVTIFGESAGGASVHYHILSPASAGLFHKAISQSGSALNEWAYTFPETAHERALAVASELGTNTTDASEALDTLLKADQKDIVKAQNSIPSVAWLPSLLGASIMYSPTIEDSDAEDVFLPDTPINILKSGNFNKVPYITGVCSAEGKMFAFSASHDKQQLQYYNDHLEDFVPQDLGLEKGSPESIALTKEAKELYFGDKDISEDTIEELVNFETDFGIVVGVHRAIKLQLPQSTTPIYTYVFSYQGKISLSNLLFMRYDFPGAGHADDIPYLFKIYLLNITLDSSTPEMQTSRQITKVWTNFAKTGTPSLDMDDISWEPLTEDKQTYLSIGDEWTIEDYTEFESDRLTMWDKAYEDIDNLGR